MDLRLLLAMSSRGMVVDEIGLCLAHRLYIKMDDTLPLPPAVKQLWQNIPECRHLVLVTLFGTRVCADVIGEWSHRELQYRGPAHTHAN